MGLTGRTGLDGHPAGARPRRLRALVVPALAVAAAGPPVGLVWWLIAPRASMAVTAEGPRPVLGNSGVEFAADGRFALMALAAGLISGYVGYAVHRRRSERTGRSHSTSVLLGVVAGSLAASLLAAAVAYNLDLPGYQAALAAAAEGEEVPAPLRLRAVAAVVLWPLGAAMEYTILELIALVWARWSAAGQAPASAAVPDGSAAAVAGGPGDGGGAGAGQPDEVVRRDLQL
ncbi:hypothetical protein [Allonocardiopsis opalescens]|uniref:DUF2567 domain-containing protein n=1 Tax=Allonocardiopsis opalescens TaxID=1144618 RepID=A0A2T0Q3X8_9ACTN|nr:hypothetical protein [Allonocardiopsis opalescens]PRX98509.1 hypothetical protein CLV72_10486 [Allonocardiopsis opalescens]